MSWKKIVKPKRDGGLGIQVAKTKNIANLAKLIGVSSLSHPLYGPKCLPISTVLLGGPLVLAPSVGRVQLLRQQSAKVKLSSKRL